MKARLLICLATTLNRRPPVRSRSRPPFARALDRRPFARGGLAPPSSIARRSLGKRIWHICIYKTLLLQSWSHVRAVAAPKRDRSHITAATERKWDEVVARDFHRPCGAPHSRVQNRSSKHQHSTQDSMRAAGCSPTARAVQPRKMPCNLNIDLPYFCVNFLRRLFLKNPFF